MERTHQEGNAVVYLIPWSRGQQASASNNAGCWLKAHPLVKPAHCNPMNQQQPTQQCKGRVLRCFCFFIARVEQSSANVASPSAPGIRHVKQSAILTKRKSGVSMKRPKKSVRMAAGSTQALSAAQTQANDGTSLYTECHRTLSKMTSSHS